VGGLKITARSPFAALVCVLSLIPPALAQVTLRSSRPGERPEPAGEVALVSPAGVTVKSASDSDTRIISWDRIASVGPALPNGPGTFTADAAPFAHTADRLWRARTRLERGDWLGAGPLLREAAPTFRDSTGPTPALVFDGLLRCELLRGARAGAAAAWFEWLMVLERAGGLTDSGVRLPVLWTGGSIDAPAIIDPATGLARDLPPIWVAETALDAAASAGDWDALLARAAAAPAPITREYIALYRAAARAEAGLPAEIPAPSVPSANGKATAQQSSGVRLVRLIVTARAAEPPQRQAAREALAAIMSAEAVEPWVEAWCRAGIGRSLLKEPDTDARTRGVLELLHLPARLSRACPYLGAVALAESARALWTINDHPGAAALKAELQAGYAGHSAAEWGELEAIRPTSPAPAVPPASAEPQASRGKDGT
jgi:hypothetical protein